MWPSFAIVLVVAVAVLVRWRTPHYHEMLGTDEADYVRASASGVVASYLGTAERSGYAFTADVLDEYRRTGWARPFMRDWNGGDAAGLRHYHPPVAFYPVAAMLEAGVRDERLLRLGSFIPGVLACLASGFLAFGMTREAARPLRLTTATAAGLLTAISPYHAYASTDVGAHVAFSLASTATLAALTRATQEAGQRWWITGCAVLGLAAVTVPYWALLLPPACWVWWQGRATGRRSLASLAPGASAAILATLVAWPPFLLSVGFVKPVLMYAGILLKPYPSSRGLGHWIPALAEAHVLILLLAVIGGVGLLVRGRGVRRAPLVPTLLFVLGFMLLNVRVSQMKPLYVSDVLAPIAALAAAAAALAAWRHAPVLARPAMTAIVAAALLAGLWNLGAPRTNRPWRRSLQDLAQRFAGQRLLVTPRAAGAMVIYYLNASDVLLDSNEPDDRAALERAVEARRIDAVFQWGGSVEPGGVAAETIAKGPPDGRATISASIVSWWRLSRP